MLTTDPSLIDEQPIHFYKEVLDKLIFSKILRRDMSILVVCGGKGDKEVLQMIGFDNVVISNLDVRMNENDFEPFRWNCQNAEKLTFEDKSFDFCIVAQGLHHCFSPHRAVLEMYRVARKGIVLLEPYDNVLTRLGMFFGFGQEFEHAAVFYNSCLHGGVQNSEIPNYIYRWTEKEIVKCINSFAPYGPHKFHFIHKMCIPWTQLKGRKNKLYFYLIRLLLAVLKPFTVFFPKQGNNFAAVVLKPKLPKEVYPWLVCKEKGINVNQTWLSESYNRKK